MPPCYSCAHAGTFGSDMRGEIVFCLHPLDNTVHDARVGCNKHSDKVA